LTVRARILSSRAEKESLGDGLSRAFFAAMRLGEDLGETLFLALFTNFVKKVRWGGLLCLLNTYRFPICLFHVCAFAFAAQDALRLG